MLIDDVRRLDLGDAGAEAEAWHRPRRVSVDEALAAEGLSTDDVALGRRRPGSVGTKRPGRWVPSGDTMRRNPGQGLRGRLPC